MKSTRISVYKKALPYVNGTYVWGAGNVIDTAMTSVVVIDTDAGISGCVEFCPCGENYMGAHSEGVEAAARLLAPVLLGGSVWAPVAAVLPVADLSATLALGLSLAVLAIVLVAIYLASAMIYALRRGRAG